jgi:hypothetical protein
MECTLNKECVSWRAKPALSTVQIESEVRVRVCVCVRACVCIHTHTSHLQLTKNGNPIDEFQVIEDFVTTAKPKNEDLNISIRTYRIRI